MIIGGARGLGRDFALDLAAAGSSVGVCDVDEAALGEAVEAAAGQGIRLWSTVADVSSESSVEQLLSAPARMAPPGRVPLGMIPAEKGVR